MGLNWCSKAHRILHFEPRFANEPILDADNRLKDQSNVKVYDQKRTVEYADYKVGLFYVSPFDLFSEGEAVITKFEKKKSRSPSE